ncbi:MAG: hypothetical protein IH831_05160 [Planctomycetes bacterium]|nr:hypothetical protein [Planctomycetota bacterium]
MWEDPIVDDVRRIRQDLSTRFNFDLAAIFDDLRNRQAGVGDRLVRLERKRNTVQGETPKQPDPPVSKE